MNPQGNGKFQKWLLCVTLSNNDSNTKSSVNISSGILVNQFSKKPCFIALANIQSVNTPNISDFSFAVF